MGEVGFLICSGTGRNILRNRDRTNEFQAELYILVGVLTRKITKICFFNCPFFLLVVVEMCVNMFRHLNG